MASLEALIIYINAKTKENWAPRSNILESIANYVARSAYKGLDVEWKYKNVTLILTVNTNTIKIPNDLIDVVQIADPNNSPINWYEDEDFQRMWPTVSEVGNPDGWTIHRGYIVFNSKPTSSLNMTVRGEREIGWLDVPEFDLIKLAKLVLAEVYPEGQSGAGLISAKARASKKDLNAEHDTGQRSSKRILPDEHITNINIVRRGLERIR